MDQIADLLTRIKNSSAIGKYEITLPYSKMKEAILNILKAEGFIQSYEMVADKDNGKSTLTVIISRTKTPSHLKQISKPGRRVYAKNAEIPMPLRGLGTVVISTSKGVITGKEARKGGFGGELICEIW
ncbi:MAG: 30S ribosomal protein S8 [Patescibacteria group bacterium]